MREEARRREEEGRQQAAQRERERREKEELERAMRDELEREKRNKAGARAPSSGVRGVRGTRASMRAGAAAARGVSRAGAPSPFMLSLFSVTLRDDLTICSIGLVDWSYKGIGRDGHGSIENLKTVIGCVLSSGNDQHPPGYLETILTGSHATIPSCVYNLCLCIISAHLYRWLDLHWNRTFWASAITYEGESN